MRKIREEDAISFFAGYLFLIGRIVAIILIARYLYNTYKPPVQLVPNDWDLPVYVTVVK